MKIEQSKYFINFSKPELFLIGIILANEPQSKNDYLKNLRQYLPGRDRIPGNCSDSFLTDVYKGLMNLNLIKVKDDYQIMLAKQGEFILEHLENKAKILNKTIADILRDILYFYDKKIFKDRAGLIQKVELLILEQIILISNPIISFIIDNLQKIYEKYGRDQITSEKLFNYAIVDNIEFVREFLVKKSSKSKDRITLDDIHTVIYDDIKNQMRNSKLISGNYGHTNFPNDIWILNIPQNEIKLC